MWPATLKQIIEQIETYIREGGGEYEDWFVGITDDPIEPIDETFKLHKVESHRFIYIETQSQEVAQAVGDYFINILGTDGNLSGNKANGVCRALYVYKKNLHLVRERKRQFVPIDSLRVRNTTLDLHTCQY